MSESFSDEFWMEEALREARLAEERREVPVGAVLVFENRIVARNGNRTLGERDPTAHAEIVTIRSAARALGNHRLPGTTLYVTLEPCAMCAGALVQARVGRLVYGAADPKSGAVESHFGICAAAFLNHRLETTGGVLAEASTLLLQNFFRARRNKE